ncbi:hypothetical protein SAMN05192569_1002222 [Parageobacillus thermantarcticus]|uniref:Transposase DDE domain-containing protein n=1 Tax=Parageobacillus thermantarcticus TaxID=186116 RepID=A0A1I0SQD2_9BACL|nr:hypothetical protein SAMN05192569_1002222 [Parageobacillus thermantarcticus]
MFCIHSTIEHPDSSSTPQSSLVETEGRGHHRRPCPWKVTRLHFRTDLGNLFSKALFPERSHNRRCRALGFAIKWIRRQLAKRGQHRAYTVMDSMPIELCHSPQMYHTKRFRGIADIGYCASNQLIEIYTKFKWMLF